MSKPMKNAIVDELTGKLQGHDSAVVFSAGKLTVHETEKLRNKLRAEGIQCLFLRNRLAAIAFERVGMKGLGGVVNGPTAVAFGGEGAIAIAKILTQEAKAVANLELRGGILEGEVLDPAGVARISTLPGKKELQAMVLHALFGPVSGFAASMNDLLTETHGLIAALEEKVGANG